MAKEAAFPKPGRYVLHSVPMFVLNRGDKTEILVCKAEMVLTTGEAYLNTGKRRQVDVEVHDWVATGRSRMLGGEIEFRLTPSRASRSWVRAGKNGDLPGTARFGMRYQVTTPQGTVKGLTGSATGAISSFPPKGDVFTVRKRLNVGDISILPIACACPADVLISVAPGLPVN